MTDLVRWVAGSERALPSALIEATRPETITRGVHGQAARITLKAEPWLEEPRGSSKAETMNSLDADATERVFQPGKFCGPL